VSVGLEILDIQFTRILRDWTAGDGSALDRLTPIIYEELHRLASIKMADERTGHLLQPSALVNEAFVRLLASEPLDWESRAHFFAHAAQLMRRILIDFARARNRQRRPPQDQRVRLSSLDNLGDLKNSAAGERGSSIDFLDLDAALDELKELNERQFQVVELRYFGGLEAEETAAVLKVAPSTVARDWRMARAWLYNRLRSEHKL
jgi:RNA polymerase sigma factor (TIGR02999 family)